MKVAIIGCGHGGQALAAQLSINGCDVALTANRQHPGGLISLIDKPVITCFGKIQGQSKRIQTTFNMAAAINKAKIIFMVLPTDAHLEQFKCILPYLQSGQIVVSLAANFTSLYLKKVLDEAGIDKDITLADISSLPYACRAEKPGRVNIIDIKSQMGLSCLPNHRNLKLQKILQPFFPSKLKVYKNSIELGMNITSGMSHPSVALLNAGRIGQGNDDFYFYKDGISPEIANVVEQLDSDRQKIGQLYDVSTPSYLELMAEFYGKKYVSVYDFFRQSQVHNALMLCPKSLSERYINQDIPYVIVPWYTLGLLAGYDSKVMRCLIDMASLLNQIDYLKQGRNLLTTLYDFKNKAHLVHYAQCGSFMCQHLKAS